MADRTLLRDARVLTCAGDPTERPVDGDVLIEGDRIVRVSAGRLEVDPASVRVVDLAGATVLPGLGDAHVHTSWPLDFVFDHAAIAATPPARHMLDVVAVVRTFLESGYTQIIGAGVTQPGDDLLAKEAIDRGLIPGPRIVPSGMMIAEVGGLGSDGELMEVASDAASLRELVARQCDAGVKALKLFISGDGVVPQYPSDDVYMDDEMLTAAVEEADRHGAFITVHARGSASVAMAARTGVRIIHHACFLDDEALTALEARRDDVWVCPGLHYLYAVVNGHARPWGITAERVEASGYPRELEAQVDGLRKLKAAGIKILSGGDFGHQWTRHGTYAAELQRYVELIDMSPVEAIHTATRNVGSVVGLPTGEVREGALADLLIVDGDPTADVTVLQQAGRRRAVLKDGRFAYVNPDLFPVTAVAPGTRTAEVLSGVDTLVRLLLLRQQVDARDGLTTATMVSGYPGSPLGTVDLAMDAMGDRLAAHRVVHRPGLNEELAMAAVWGSQMGTVVPYDGIDGVAGAWYGKGPGLDRSGDSLKHGNAMGSGPNGGVVLFCGDDPGSKSSTLACDSQYALEDACVPVLYPADQQDLLDLGVHAFRMSRWSGAWVALKIVTNVADGIGSVDVDPDRQQPADPSGVLVDGVPWEHRPLATIGPHAVPDQEVLVVERRLRAARAYARHNGLDRVLGAAPGAPLGIVCAGKTYVDVVQALADLGAPLDALADAGVRVLKLGMTYPLVEETALEFAASVDELLVVEEKRPFVETQLRAVLHEAGSRVPVVGKRDRAGNPLVSSVGELDAPAVAAVLARVRPELAPRPPAAAVRTALPLLQLPARPPGFCSGCPHNRSTVAPEGALVGGGVGCHGIMYFEPRNADLRRLPPTPMGAEGVPWIGLAPFVAEPHLIQNLGDGTLSHSGTLAIRASVAAGVNVTFKVLYNAAVAMTGGQDVTGAMDVPALTRALAAEGVRRIVVCAEDPKRYGRRARWAAGVAVHGRDRLDAVQRELEGVEGVTVIVYDQQCAAEARRLRKRGLQEEPPRRVVINEAVCEGCGDCSTKSNCLSVQPLDTEFGVKRQVHDLSCNRDYTCLEGDCPSFVTLTPRKRGRRVAAASAPRPALPSGELPEPPLPEVGEQYGIYFTGIGGTGVITANRILASAAEAAGLVVGGVDQTGLSQKAGSVVSHLRLARDREALGSAAVTAGGADLYLSGDVLQAAGPKHLEKVTPGRTLAVVDVGVTQTVAMMQGSAPMPAGADLRAAITDRVGADRVAFVDAGAIAERVFANHLLGNVVLLGAAFQRGGLPIALADIDRAMRKGRGAADNRDAFAWGRWAAHDPAAVEAALAAPDSSSITDPSADAVRTARDLVAGRRLPDELRDLLTRRAAQAVDYQDAARGRRYLDLVETVAARDDAARGWALTRAVAEAWFPLLTYKDEYEVARLHLLADYDRIARDLGIDGPYALTYHLHPPVLRRLGVDRKLPMGRPYEIAFRGLRRMKRLRGTPLDVFGYDPDRRMERRLIGEYERLVLDAVAPSAGLPYDTQVRLAGSADTITGYGPIKEASVAAWREQVAALLREADPVPAPPTPIH